MPTSCCIAWSARWKNGFPNIRSAEPKARKFVPNLRRCSRITRRMPDKVYIIGAGPGAADLLTLRAANLLRAAHVVLHEDLVPREILDLCPCSAEIVNVGKRCGRQGSSQERINALMIWHATEPAPERTIVRLKSGDPSVFGRLGEEIEALRRAGVPYEIVPGVT